MRRDQPVLLQVPKNQQRNRIKGGRSQILFLKTYLANAARAPVTSQTSLRQEGGSLFV